MNQNLSETGIFHSGLSYIPRALCNDNALFTLFATSLLTMALVFLGYAVGNPGSFATALIIFPTLLVVLPAGISVAGLLFMDQACGQSPRPFRKAISDGIPAFLRTFGIMLLSVVLIAVFYLFLCLLLLVCKLPTIGSVLYAVLFPVLVILAGLLYLGLMAGLSMACPAIWSGATIRETLEILWRIATNRTAELLVNLLLLTAFIVLAVFILLGIFLIGNWIVQGGAKFILGIRNVLGIFDIFAFTQDPVGFFAALSNSNYILAIIFGSMTGLMLFLSALTAMTLMGLNLIYLRVTKNLPPLKAWKYAWNFMPQSGNNGNKKESMIQPVPHDNASSNPGSNTPNIMAALLAKTVSAVTAMGTAKTTLTCPRCRASTQPDDRFCGECGSRLQD